MQPLYIYVHGFNSSPESAKAKIFLEYMQQQGKGSDVKIPALSNLPKKAIAQLQQLIEASGERPVILLGSSLGGYYSTWLTERYSQVRAVLINPAVYPYLLLPDYLGTNTNLHTGEEYELTEEHLNQLKKLDCKQITRPEAYLLLAQTGDETLDYREAVAKFANSPQFIQTGGSHGFEQFERLLSAILAFGAGRLELPEATVLPST